MKTLIKFAEIINQFIVIMKINIKQILLIVAISAATSIVLDFILPLKQKEDGNLARINM